MELFIKQQLKIIEERLLHRSTDTIDKQINAYLKGKKQAFGLMLSYIKQGENLTKNYPEIFNDDLQI